MTSAELLDVFHRHVDFCAACRALRPRLCSLALQLYEKARLEQSFEGKAATA